VYEPDDRVQLAGIQERAVALADVDHDPGDAREVTRFIILPQRTQGRYLTRRDGSARSAY
jgi:hypothetical protein